MSVWTQIEGTVTIPVRAHVSIRDVIRDVLSDEAVVTEEVRNDDQGNRVHTLSIGLDMEGQDVYPQIPEFISRLKSVSRDLTFTLRFL